MARPVIKMQATRSIADSQGMIRRWLKDYGCDNFTMGERDGIPFIGFELPINDGAKHIPIFYKIHVDRYAKVLIERDPWTSRKHKTQKQWDHEKREQAEKSAWSLVADKLAADLSLVELELQTLEDVFLSKIMSPDGTTTIGEAFSVEKMLAGKNPLQLGAGTR